jgi:8-amino-7-oxononanoate synthase
MFVQSKSAIQSVIVPVMAVKAIAKQLQDYGFDARTLLSPTVPEGKSAFVFV